MDRAAASSRVAVPLPGTDPCRGRERRSRAPGHAGPVPPEPKGSAVMPTRSATEFITFVGR